MFRHKIVAFLVLFLLAWPEAAWGQTERPALEPAQVQAELIASYRIEAALDVENKMLSGRETISYINRTDQPFKDLVFHLYLNAFRDENSLFFRESGPTHRMFSYDPEFPGWIEVIRIELADGTPLTLQLLEDGTLAKADLPQPVMPGEQILVEVEFQAQLPRVFARTGFAGDFFMVGQWFPKLGVWEDGAWNAYPFHANAEFYADFGAYDVAITLPQDYRTGATGLPVDQVQNADGTQTITYHAEPVIDFAWTASPHFREATRQVGGVEVRYLYLPEHEWTVNRMLAAAEASLTAFGEWFGPYPYKRLTVVDVPDDAGGAGGMEYPTLVTAGAENLLGLGGGFSALGVDRSLELVAIHEIGHQWWQSMVAFNEAEEPWLDEGFTDYSSVRLAQQLYGDESAFDLANLELSYLDLRRMEYLMNPNVPMYGRAWDYPDLISYGVASYSKPALSLLTLEGFLGEETMLTVMSTFFQGYQYGHPKTEDFRRVAEEVSGQDLAWFFDGLVYGDGWVNYSVVEVEENSATVARQGEVRVPVEVRVAFTDGSEAREVWSGTEQQKEFSYPDRPTIQSAEVDPDLKVLVDLQWSDNGLAREPQVWPWLALLTRLLYQIQNAMLMMGGL